MKALEARGVHLPRWRQRGAAVRLKPGAAAPMQRQQTCTAVRALAPSFRPMSTPFIAVAWRS